jgi:hypothetical protein
MPKQVKARVAQDEREERQVRKLARSHHAPADWKVHAQMVVESWADKTPNEIAAELGCHPQTVRIHLARRERGGGRRSRDETMEARDEEGSAQWSLDALTQAAHAAGIQVPRSQIRRIYIREGVRWRRTHSWGSSDDEDFVRNPDRGRHSLHRAARRVDDHLHRRTR